MDGKAEPRRLDRETALAEIIVGLGYEILEGEFVRKDGSLSPVFVRPVDPRRIAKSLCTLLNEEWAHHRREV